MGIDMRMLKIDRANPSDVLDLAPAFLRTLSLWQPVRRELERAGYTAAEHALGWRLLLTASGYAPEAPAPRLAPEVLAAMTELDGADEGTFLRARAALRRHHPEQEAFVFAGLEPGSGAASVVATALFLERLDALESSPERAATRDDDHAALATLAARGIDPDERARLARLVHLAQGARLELAPEGPSPTERDAALGALIAWYADWSDTARAVVKRRDHRIALGLGKRRRRSEPEVPDATVPT